MSLAFRTCSGTVVLLCSCAPVDDGLQVTSDLTSQALLDQSIVLFSHDHVRNTVPVTGTTVRAPHFDDARNGGVTGMTLELTVDNWVWCSSGVTCLNTGQTVGPVGTFAAGSPLFVEPFEQTSHITPRFQDAKTSLDKIIADSAGNISLITSIADLDAVKAAGPGHLGIMIGTEGSGIIADNQTPTTNASIYSNVVSRYAQGWRKTQIFRSYYNPFAMGALTELGRSFVSILNKKGVVVDAMHLYPGMIDRLFQVTNAPILASHDWACDNVNRIPQAQLNEIIASGGGHGVVGINSLTASYAGCATEPGNTGGPGGPAHNLSGFVDTLMIEISRVGIDHIAIGPDYMPEGGTGPADSTYALTPAAEGNAIPVLALINELRTRQLVPPVGQGGPRPVGDDDIKKILGGNLKDLYQRTWDPTRGYYGGDAHLQLCSNADSDSNNVNAVADCKAAASNGGQGDLNHRAINCGHSSGWTPVGSQLAYQFVPPAPGLPPAWTWVFKMLNGSWSPCSTSSQALTLVAAWDDGHARNASIALHGTAGCDAGCQAAINLGGAGTANARALNCQSATSNGVVGLQLVFANGGWNFYDIAAHLQSCAPQTTLVASWATGLAGANARVRLCDDANNHVACATAASFAGNGTAQAKALNCLSSTAKWNPALGAWEHGTNALQVFYSDHDFDNPDPAHWNDLLPDGGHWRYWDVDGTSHRCVHGSVLVATTL